MNLLPVEDMALTVAKAQIERGEVVSPNIATTLIIAIIRDQEQREDHEATT